VTPPSLVLEGDRGEQEGVAAMVNGLALCAIHHLAVDRNLLDIDPDGLVHIADRLLRETDGPMLRTGLLGFHAGDCPSAPAAGSAGHRIRYDAERCARR
jgi:hypothetical protein